MAWKRIKYSKWVEGIESSPNPENFNGDSPGTVASELEISRQAVHQAIRRGDLDAWRVERDKTGELVAIYVTPESVRRYKALRKLRGAA